MSYNYCGDLALPEEDGVKNTLVKLEELPNVPKGVRAWLTVPDAGPFMRKPVSTLYTYIYRNQLVNRVFKKHEKHRQGVCLVPVDGAIEFIENEIESSLQSAVPDLNEILSRYLTDEETRSVIGNVKEAAKQPVRELLKKGVV
jgi:hypothetical protein